MVKWSFVIPAYNEAAVLGGTLAGAFEAGRALGEPFEVIVVDDASTDGTGDLAAQAGARVVRVEKRQIAAVRNAGAQAAEGRVLVFVDADTRVTPELMGKARAALEAGAIGGGAPVRFDREPEAMLARVAVAWWNGVSRTMRWAAGCFIFVRREAFEAIGGFDERYFAGEEVYFSKALKRRGKFVVLDEPVETSGRKARTYSPWQVVKLLAWVSLTGGLALRSRRGLGLWYDGVREEAG